MDKNFHEKREEGERRDGKRLKDLK